MLNVVLIQPAEPFGGMAEIPYSIIGLASILQQGGVSVEILDARLDDLTVSQTLKRLEGKNIDVVGITGLNNAYRYIKDFCFEFKRKYPDTPLIAGGPFILSQPERILERVPIDVACIGEGEEIILDLVTRLANKESLHDLNNIAYIQDGDPVKTEIKTVEDLDKFPFPAYDLLEMDRYLNATHIQHWNMFYFPISAGRGCIYHCYYCGRAFRKVQRPSPERVIEHMDLLNSRYGIRAFLFSEDNAFSIHDWIIRLCELLIDSERGYNIIAPACADHLDDEIVGYLARAGFSQMDVAVEHWNPEIQKGFYRINQSKYIVRAWELFKKYGIHNNGFNILWGHPKDTANSFRETYGKSVEMAHKYDIPHFWLAALVIYPNSQLQEDALKMGKIVDYEDYMYASGGYGPYVNLTTEDDDTYISVILEQQLVNSIDLYTETLKCRLSQKYLQALVGIFARLILAVPRQVLLGVGVRLILKPLLSLPIPPLKRYREALAARVNVPIYDPKRNYYHEIGCLKEILELEEDSRLAMYAPDSFEGDNLGRLFNSIREARVQLVGFVDNASVEETFEGYRLVSLSNLDSLQPGCLVVPDDEQNSEKVIKVVSAQWPGVKLIKLAKSSLSPKPWITKSLTSGYYNKRFYKVELEGNRGVRKIKI